MDVIKRMCMEPVQVYTWTTESTGITDSGCQMAPDRYEVFSVWVAVDWIHDTILYLYMILILRIMIIINILVHPPHIRSYCTSWNYVYKETHSFWHRGETFISDDPWLWEFLLVTDISKFMITSNCDDVYNSLWYGHSFCCIILPAIRSS